MDIDTNLDDNKESEKIIHELETPKRSTGHNEPCQEDTQQDIDQSTERPIEPINYEDPDQNDLSSPDSPPLVIAMPNDEINDSRNKSTKKHVSKTPAGYLLSF